MRRAQWIAFLTIVTTLLLLDSSSADGFWRRRLLPLRLHCEPLIVEPCIPAPAPAVKPPEKVAKEEPLPPIDKDIRINIKNIAGLMREGKPAQARKLAVAVAPTVDELADLMHLYRPRNKEGMGWGPTPGKNPALDGLEKGIQRLATGNTTMLSNDVEAALYIAAIAEVTIAKVPQKDHPTKPRQAWLRDASEVREGAMYLAQAFLDNDVKAATKAAVKINSACAKCHSRFKE